MDWFYDVHLRAYFELEENHIFPILGNDHPWIKKALADHRRLTRLLASTDYGIKTLGQIEEELEQHIRFEERQLFNEIQQLANEAQLHIIAKHHNDEKFNDNTDDPFWN